jgi:F0F1-type ATP synthase assembly protein I
MPDEAPNPREMGLYFALGQVGLEMVAPIGLGVLLDRWLHTAPTFIVIGVLLGFVGGLAHLMALLKRLDRSNSRNNKSQQGES